MNNYVIQNIRGFSEKIFYSAMKTQYGEYKKFLIDNPKCSENIKENLLILWENIPNLTIQDCFSYDNQSQRSVLFSCFGPENIIKNFGGKVIDKKTILKKNIVFDEHLKEKIVKYEDTYTLYEIMPEEFYKGIEDFKTVSIKMVHCKCTTTKKDYYLYVSPHITDAIQAIASTFRVNVSSQNIEEIYRQGDVIIIKTDINCKPRFYSEPISKENYLEKLKIES